MAQADGSIIIDSKIDTEGFRSGAKNIETAAKRMAQSVKGISETARVALEKQVNSIEKQSNSIQAQANKVDGLKEKVAALKNQKVPTDTYQNLGMELTELYKKYDALEAKMNEWRQMGFSPDSGAFASVNRELDEVYENIERVLAKRREMEASGTAYKKPDTDAADAKLLLEEAKLVNMNNRLETSLSQVKNSVDKYSKSANAASGASGRLSNAVKKVSDSSKRASSGLKDVSKSTDRAGFSIARMVGMSVLYSTVFRLISMVTQGVVTGMNNLAQYSSSTNAALSSMASSLLYLQNSFAAAFSPVLEVVVPILATLIDAIATALAWIGQFMAALTGKGTYVKAIKVQKDYAAGLAGTGKAAKGAAKDAKAAAKEANLSTLAFDELNQLQSDTGSGGSGGGGGGAGGGGGGGADPSVMFETVEVDSKITDAIEKAKAAIGTFLTWLNTNFGASLSQVSSDFMKNVGDLHNILMGMFSDVSTLGAPLWQWLNTDFVEFGNQLITTSGTIVNGVFESFNMVLGDLWDAVLFPVLESLVVDGLPMVTQFGTETLKTLETTFTEIKTLFDSIWSGGVVPVLEHVGVVFSDLMEIIRQAWDEHGRTIFDNFRESIQLIGDRLMAVWAVIEPIVQKAMEIAGRLWDNHLKPLVENIIEFGAKFVEVAQTIYNEFVSPIATWLIETIGPYIADFVIFCLEKGEILLSGVTDVINLVFEVLNWLLDWVLVIFQTDWGEAFENVKEKAFEIWNNITSFLSEKWETIKENAKILFDATKKYISDKWEETKKDTSEKWQSIKTSLSETWETVKSNATTYFSEVKNNISEAWEQTKSDTSEKWDNIKKSLSDTWETTKKNAGDAFENIKKSISDAWDNVKNNTDSLWGKGGITDTIKNAVNGALSSIEGFVNGIIDAINGMIAKLNSLSIDIPDTPFTDGFTIGFNIPPLDHVRVPRLAMGTVVPPRAGEFLAMLGDNNRETEVVSPLSTMKQALSEVMSEYGGGQQIVIKFEGSAAQLARYLKPALDAESKRVGVKLVVGGR